MIVHLFLVALGAHFSFFRSPALALSSQLCIKCRHYVTSFRPRKFQQKTRFLWTHSAVGVVDPAFDFLTNHESNGSIGGTRR